MSENSTLVPSATVDAVRSDVRSPDRAMANGWWACGSVAMGTGIWAMHFVGMQALQVPFEFGFGHAVTGLSWVAAVGVSALALYIASFKQLSIGRLAAGALAMIIQVLTLMPLRTVMK